MSPNSAVAVSLNDVTVTYPDGENRVVALDKVSLDVQAGEFIALVGESGSGKSTLLSVAAGLVVPDSGTVTVADRRLDKADEATRSRIRRDHIGIIFQQANLIASLTVCEQLLVMDHVRGVSMRPSRADELLALVGLSGFGNRRMHQLSGGQRQRVNIARALMADPSLLLADEPTSALDSRLSKEIMDVLSGVVKELGVATVVVTHDRSLLRFTDRSVEACDGRIAACQATQ